MEFCAVVVRLVNAEVSEHQESRLKLSVRSVTAAGVMSAKNMERLLSKVARMTFAKGSEQQFHSLSYSRKVYRRLLAVRWINRFRSFRQRRFSEAKKGG